MVEINRSQLLRNDPGDGSDVEEVLSTRQEQTAPIAQLQSKARYLGAFDIETVIGRFDPDRITPRQRRQMRRDPMINLGLHYRKSVLMGAKWHIDCDDPQVKAFAENALRAIYGRLIAQMCLRDPFGYVPIVKRFQREVPSWQYEDPDTKVKKDVWTDKTIPAVTWNSFQALPPEGAEVLFTEDGRTFAGFRHGGFTGSMDGTDGPLEVDAAHALWVTRNYDEEFGNWYGYPLTGHAFRYWWSYWYQWLLSDKHMENRADPPVIVDYPPGQSFSPDEPGMLVDNHVIALAAGTTIRDGSTVAVPSDYYENLDTGAATRGAKKWDIRFLTGGENIDAFHKSFTYIDAMKLLAILVPPEGVSGAKGTLSGNVADTYLGAMTQSAEVEMAQLDQIINDYMLPDLLEQNFVDPPKATKVTDGFSEQDIALGIQLLTTVAATDPGGLQVDWRELARQHNLPLHDGDSPMLQPLGQNQDTSTDNPRQKIADPAAQRANEKAIIDGGGAATAP